jgi:glycosyltransferase involved in cell wall biosynthesis
MPNGCAWRGEIGRWRGIAKVRILLVHNYYGSTAPSGENQVFESERALLESRGHVVETFTRHSDEIRRAGPWGMLKGALATPWNPWMTRAIRREIDHYKPDVVHVHNTFPLISPAIFSAIGAGAARVLTLHNYRLFCPAGIPMRDGQVCTACLDAHSTWPAMRYGCYRGSRFATAPLAFSVELRRRMKTWLRQVDAFIVLSEFQRQRMAGAGLPVAKMHVKPNFYPGFPPLTPWPVRAPCVVFAGRLTAEKGVTTLLRAWRLWGTDAPELRLIGDGELRAVLENLARDLPVRFLGQIPGAEAQKQIAGARLLVLPSECFEGFPMVVREAFAFGTPVAVSDIGPLPDIVRDGISGVVFVPGNADSLLCAVRALWDSPAVLARLGQGARQEFETKYTEDVNYATLMAIYQQAIKVSRGART